MELTLSEVKKLIKYITKNNQFLQEKGEYPISLCLNGLAGIGKTALVKQIAKELNSNFIFLNLSSLTDPGELCGWPIKEHYVCKDDECKWITGELVDSYTKAGYHITEDTRMSYALPSWLKGLDANKPTILCLDDLTRCTPAILQALMSVIYEQEYISWKLPKNTTIIVTTNPDDGNYNVSSIDEAFLTRMITFNIKFDIKDWISWAESKHVDDRAIHFLALNPELITSEKNRPAKINARSYMLFTNIISGIPDWSNINSLASILQIADACFPQDIKNIVGNLFTQFISNKLDKLLTPEELVHGSWSSIKSILEEQLYDKTIYRADIAALMTNRFINYTLNYFKDPKSDSKIILNRIIELIDNEKILLTEDLIFSLIKTLTSKYSTRCSKLLLHPTVVKRLL